MLVKNSRVTVGDIVGFKLVSGEEVVGKLEANDIACFTVSKPMVVTLTPRGVASIPALLSGTDDAVIELKKVDVMYHDIVNHDMDKSYRQSISSIELVPPGTRL
jgi:hypothetical protein